MNNTPKTIEPFYRFRAEATGEPEAAELLIFSVIGDWEEFGEVSALAFAKDLARLPASIKKLSIHMNSPGGSVSEAYGIYSRLADHRSEKTVYIDGIVASAATIVAMVGHKIYIRANANMMVHLPMAFSAGNANDMRSTAAALDSITESMINVYSKRTKLGREEVRDLLTAETWMSPQVAVEKGFADEQRGVIKAAAMLDNKRVIVNGLTFDLSRFHNIPAFTGQQPTGDQNPNMETPTPPATATGAPPTPPPTAPTPPAPAPAAPTPPAAPPATSPATPTPPAPPAPPTPPTAKTDRQLGMEDERARIVALQKLEHPATHDLIVKAIADGRTAADITSEVFEAMKNAGTQQSRRVDAQNLDQVPPSGQNQDDPEAKDFAALLKTKVTARLKKGNVGALHSRN